MARKKKTENQDAAPQAEEPQQEQTRPQESPTEESDALKNTVTIEDTGPCKKKVTIRIPEEKIHKTLDEKFSELRKEALIPGFRKGRAPLRLVEKRFSTDIRQQTKLQLMAEASEEALKEHKLDTLGEPEIDHEKIELPENGPMTFDFEVEVRPEFDLPEVEGIEIKKPRTEVKDEQIDEELNAMRRRAGVWVPKEDQGVEEGDQVVADVVLLVEGSEEKDKRDNVELFARKPGFVAGVPVEDLAGLLAGAKYGDKRKTAVDVPDTYFNEDYRGKKIEIEIEVKEVKRLEPAEMNAEFFSRYGVESEQELRDRIRESLTGYAEQQARSAMSDQVYEYLLKNTQFDLPGNVVADQSLRLLQRQYVNLLMRGTPREEVEEKMDQLRASSEEQAKEQLKLFFIMDKLADKFDIQITEEEINGHIAQVAAQRGRRPEKMREELARDGSLAQFAAQVREHKCIEKILEKAKVTDEK